MCAMLGLLLLVWAVSSSHSFNLELREALVFPYPGPPHPRHRQPYFGFTVALHLQHDGEPWLIVGAPRANSSQYQSEDVVEPGTVFKCSLHNNQQCQEIIIPVHLPTAPVEGNNIYRSHMWLGGSLDSQPTYCNDRQATVVCAPLLRSSIIEVSWTLMNGACFWLNSSLVASPFSQKSPLSDKEKQSIKYTEADPDVYYYIYGQAGFSVHFPDDHTKILLGAPGVFDWQGTVVRLKDFRLNIHEGSRRRKRRQAHGSNERFMFASSYVPNPDSTTQIKDYDMAGYSVTSGRYLEKDRVLYATGAPNGANSRGKVIIFDFPSTEYGEESLDVVQELIGPQFGASFGAALASPDINGDGLSDLVVGAPLFYESELPDMGMVRIALSSKGKKLQESNTSYNGSGVSFARFGTTLASVGDLNADGYEDFAVGAPFEGNGAVYIYLGADGDMPSSHSQRLTPDDFSAGLRGFGMALSRGVDVDKNDYPDLAIGSFLSGHAVVIKSRPVAVLTANITSSPTAIMLGDTAFTVTACVHYHGMSVPTVTAIKGTLTLDPVKSRIQFSDTKTTSRNFATNIRVDNLTCIPYSIDVKDITTSVHEPILLQLSYELAEDPEQPLIGQPIGDPEAETEVISRVRIMTGCETEICKENLFVAANFIAYDHGQRMVLGEDKTVKLSIRVSNSGEPSFQPTMTVRVDPPLALILPATHNCNFADTGRPRWRTELACYLSNPIGKDGEDAVEVEIDTRKLSDAWSELRAEVVVSGEGEEVLPQDNTLTAVLELQTSATLRFEGYSNGEQIVYRLDEDGKVKSIGTGSVLHHFNLVKEGPTPLTEVSVDISVPHSFIGGSTFVQVFTPQSVVSDESIVVVSRNVTALADHLPPSSTSAISKPVDERMNARGADIHCSSQEVACNQFHYVVGPWPSGTSSVHFSIRLDVNLTVLADHLPSHVGVLKSTAIAMITSFKQSLEADGEISTGPYSVGTKILENSLTRKGVPWWVILLAVLGGLAILGLIVYGLYSLELSFFSLIQSSADSMTEMQNTSSGDQAGCLERTTPPSQQAQVLPSTPQNGIGNARLVSG